MVTTADGRGGCVIILWQTHSKCPSPLPRGRDLRVDVGAQVVLVVEHAQEGRGVVPLSSEGGAHA
jgi:hypothetical protein